MTKKRKLKYGAVKQCFTAPFCQVYQQFFPFHKTRNIKKAVKQPLKTVFAELKTVASIRFALVTDKKDCHHEKQLCIIKRPKIIPQKNSIPLSERQLLHSADLLFQLPQQYTMCILNRE